MVTRREEYEQWMKNNNNSNLQNLLHDGNARDNEMVSLESIMKDRTQVKLKKRPIYKQSPSKFARDALVALTSYMAGFATPLMSKYLKKNIIKVTTHNGNASVIDSGSLEMDKCFSKIKEDLQ